MSLCDHGFDEYELCPICDGIEPTDEDLEVVKILLENALLTGAERRDLEDIQTEKAMDPERFQEICNSHISVIHAAQRQ
jgi:hypothetical protein